MVDISSILWNKRAGTRHTDRRCLANATSLQVEILPCMPSCQEAHIADKTMFASAPGCASPRTPCWLGTPHCLPCTVQSRHELGPPWSIKDRSSSDYMPGIRAVFTEGACCCLWNSQGPTPVGSGSMVNSGGQAGQDWYWCVVCAHLHGVNKYCHHVPF